MVALDKKNGHVLWQSQSDSAGYSSPMAFDAGGKRQVVVFTGDAALGLDAKNGELAKLLSDKTNLDDELKRLRAEVAAARAASAVRASHWSCSRNRCSGRSELLPVLRAGG